MRSSVKSNHLDAKIVAPPRGRLFPEAMILDRSRSQRLRRLQYTCGGWMKNNPIPGDQASWLLGYSSAQLK